MKNNVISCSLCVLDNSYKDPISFKNIIKAIGGFKMLFYQVLIQAIFFAGLGLLSVEGHCDVHINIHPNKRACPAGMRDDGTSCWKDSYGRGGGHVPYKAPCPSGTRDDGTSCWIDSYGRGGGRSPDKAPCPSGLRDDGTSCWNDAHIYGKGCCCTLWGCCNRCRGGYHDDGCTCRKTNVGIKMTLFQRQRCRDYEEKYGGLCYPRCKAGYYPVGCCVCEPRGGPRIVKTLAQRQSCRGNEEMHGVYCYPKCKPGYRPVGCCLCEPKEGPGIKVTLFDRYYCTDNGIKFLAWCIEMQRCPFLEIVEKFESLGKTLTESEKQELRQLLASKGKLQDDVNA